MSEMGAPQIIMIVLITMSVMIEVILHGEQMNAKHSAPREIVAKAILVLILHWGGFW